MALRALEMHAKILYVITIIYSRHKKNIIVEQHIFVSDITLEARLQESL